MKNGQLKSRGSLPRVKCQQPEKCVKIVNKEKEMENMN